MNDSPLVCCFPSWQFPFFPVNIIGMNTKGCASDILCGNNLLNTLGSISGTQMTCCEGILCNSGQSLKQSLFPLLVPLLSLLFLWNVSCFWFSGLFVLYQHTHETHEVCSYIIMNHIGATSVLCSGFGEGKLFLLTILLFLINYFTKTYPDVFKIKMPFI